MEWLIFTAGVFNFGLGILVLIRNRNRENAIFSIFVLASVILISFDFLFRFKPTLLILQSAYAFAALVPSFALFWVLNFTKRKINKIGYFFIFGPSLFFFATSYSDGLIIKNINYLTILGFKGTNGNLFTLYSIIIGIYLAVTIYFLFAALKKAHGLLKSQILYIIFGLCGYGLSAITFALILPTFFNIYDLTLLDAPSSLIFVAFTSYAIIKYRLLNIRIILARSFLYFLLVSVVSSIFTFTLFVLAEFFQGFNIYGRFTVIIISSFAVVTLLDPLKALLAKITDSIFFKNKMDYQIVLQSMTIAIAREIDLEKLIFVIRERIQNELKIKAVDVLLKADGHYASLSSTSQKKIDTTCALIDYLNSQGEAIITEEFYHKTNDLADGVERSVNEQVLADLERHGIELCVPVFLEGDLKALIILGQKRSGDIYSTDDVNFFKTLAPQIAVAIEKSQLYESIGEFNIKLQDKIDKATKKLRDTNLQLEEANAHLTQLDKAKSEFLSIASHQLRTPTAAIKGYLSMMLEGDFGTVPDKQKKVISDLFESASRLARLINVFLNVSRIESGRFKLDKALIDINTLVEGVIKELQGQAKMKKLGLTFNKGKIPQAYVDGDKIREVILNLIDNAIKYSPKGEIVINTFLEGGYVHFEVHDQGIGIRPDDVPQLFHKFVRGTGVAQINTQGSGLGLYIGQRVINEHGGKIWAESKGLEQGSVFHFVVPIGEAPSGNGSAKKNQSGKSKSA